MSITGTGPYSIVLKTSFRAWTMSLDHGPEQEKLKTPNDVQLLARSFKLFNIEICRWKTRIHFCTKL